MSKNLKGHGAPGNDSPIGGSYRYYASDIPQGSYDPDKAKFHMKKAGAEGATFFLPAVDAAFAGAIDAAAAGADAGHTRLNFIYGNQILHLTIDAAGNLIEPARIDFTSFSQLDHRRFGGGGDKL